MSRFVAMYVFLFLIIIPGLLPGQNSTSLLPFDMILLQIENRNNLHSFSGNPAWLGEKRHPWDFRSRTISHSRWGDYRLPFSPESKQEYLLFLEGYKQLKKNQHVAGSFNFWRRNRKNVMWADTEAPYSGNPFLLADHSTGNFDLNGIFWQAEYQVDLGKWRAGANLYYRVDQDRKQVYPKPELRHRDVAVKWGVGFVPDDRFVNGFSFAYFNRQEQVKIRRYNLDQDLTPTLYKFRGFDFPIIVSGKSAEERLSEGSGWQYALDGQLKPVSFWTLRYQTGFTGFRQSSRDGGAYPVDQGSWRFEKPFFSLQSQFSLDDLGSHLYLTAAGFRKTETARYPDPDFETYTAKMQSLRIGTGLEWHITAVRVLGIESAYTSCTWRRTDRLNGILFYVPASQMDVTIAWQEVIEPNLQGMIFSGFGLTTPGDSKMFTTDNGSFFHTVFEPEWLYHSRQLTHYLCGGMLVWRTGAAWEFRLSGSFNRMAEKTSHKNRNFVHFTLELNHVLLH